MPPVPTRAPACAAGNPAEPRPAEIKGSPPEARTMGRARILGIFCVLLAATPALAQQPAAAGRIKVASGEVVVVRAGATSPAAVGQDLFESDHVRTGADGQVGITLKD